MLPSPLGKDVMKSLETALYALGITIGYENFEQLQQLEAAFAAEYNPATPTERALVDSLAHTEWMLRRYRWLETEVWNAARLALPPEQRTRAWPAHVFVAEKAIAQIHRLRNSAQRTFRETVAVLQKLQSGRPVSAPATEDRAPAPEPVALPVVAPAPQASSPDPLPPPG